MAEIDKQGTCFAELHNRPFPLLGSPVAISQLAFHNPAPLQEELAHIAVLAQRYGVAPPGPDASCYYQSMGEFEFRWERHTEFSSYIVISPACDDTPFHRTAVSILPQPWLTEIAGEVLSRDHIELRPAPASMPGTAELHPFFEGHSLIGSRVRGGQATLFTALRDHSDGYCRTLIFSTQEDPCESGRLVRNLLELSAYRNLTLHALPLARDLVPLATSMEAELARLTRRLTAIGSFADEKSLLQELSALAAQLEQLTSDNDYRFAATEAYYHLAEDRLRELEEQPLPSLRTLQQFHSRRFRPGFATCRSVRSRLQGLSLRVNRASGLLRTRVDLVLEAQNQDLLRSMNRRARLQLRMQQTVEGLSIIAMTHYALSLLSHLLGGVPGAWLPVDKAVIVAAATPLLLMASWFSVRRIRRHFMDADSQLETGR